MSARRSKAARKAAATRARRRELRIQKDVADYMAGKDFDYRDHCRICNRLLRDRASMERGIGAECWQDVLRRIERARAEAA
jgi:hypothetical protein